MPNYKTIPKCLGNASVVNKKRIAYCSHHKAYDARVLVTIPHNYLEQNLCPLKNHPKFVFIHHHAEKSARKVSKCNNIFREILHWDNSYVAGDQLVLRKQFPIHKLFTPSFLPISPYPSTTLLPKATSSSSTSSLLSTGVSISVTRMESALVQRVSPYCYGSIPTAIIQGSISDRRDLSEIETILEAGKSEFKVKVLTKVPPLQKWMGKEDWQIEWFQMANMTYFHEAFQGAAFLIAGISPTSSTSKLTNYFSGHQSSNIAYALHFGLQIIGHEAIKREYLSLGSFPGGEKVGYWHDGTISSMIDATKQATAEWRQRCLVGSKL